MKVSMLRDKLLEEISKIPDDRVPEVFNFLHHFRLGLSVKSSNPREILKFAGNWNDMSEKDFDDFPQDVTARRKNAFISRRNREASID